ncbi:unnamed protein product, partial [Rotaria sordida]
MHASLLSHKITSESIKLVLSYSWLSIKYLFHLLQPSTIHNTYNQFRQMTFKDMIQNLYLLLIKCIHLLFIIIIYGFRTLTYCIWNLMAEDDQQDIQRSERTSSPLLPHRRDYRLPSISIPQHGFNAGEDLIAVNAFGVDLNLDSESKHSTRIMESRRKSSCMSSIGSSAGQSLLSLITNTTMQLSSTTTYNRNQPSTTSSGGNKPQSITATNMLQNIIENSKNALEINTQTEYQQKRSSPNINSIAGKNDDVMPLKSPIQTDFEKKAL